MSRYVASLARRCFIATCESSVPSCSPSCALVETVRSFSTLRIASQGCGKATDELRGTVLPPVAREIVSQQQQARQFSSTGSPIMLKSPSDAGGPPKPYSCVLKSNYARIVTAYVTQFFLLYLQIYEATIQGDRVWCNSMYESRICSQEV